MEYRPKFTWVVFLGIFLAPAILIFYLIEGYRTHDYFLIAGFFVVSVVFFMLFNFFHLLKLILFKESILTVNEKFICDNYQRIKYCWKDIEIGEADGCILTLKLYNPEEYIDKYHSAFRRFQAGLYRKIFKKVPSYYIDLRFVATNRSVEAILKTINDYSIMSES